MKLEEIEKKIINIIFASGEGISSLDIFKILNLNKEEDQEESGEKENLNKYISNIKNKLNEVGLELVVMGDDKNNTYTITTNTESADILSEYFKVSLEEDLTPAQLQTLTIVAYLVEVSIQQVSFIRGVQSAQTMRALSTRGLVKKIGENYFLTLESFKILGISNNQDLKDFQKINENLKAKLSEALNG